MAQQWPLLLAKRCHLMMQKHPPRTKIIAIIPSSFREDTDKA
jgi:hypothetical protein